MTNKKMEVGKTNENIESIELLCKSVIEELDNLKPETYKSAQEFCEKKIVVLGDLINEYSSSGRYDLAIRLSFCVSRMYTMAANAIKPRLPAEKRLLAQQALFYHMFGRICEPHEQDRPFYALLEKLG